MNHEFHARLSRTKAISDAAPNIAVIVLALGVVIASIYHVGEVCVIGIILSFGCLCFGSSMTKIKEAMERDLREETANKEKGEL